MTGIAWSQVRFQVQPRSDGLPGFSLSSLLFDFGLLILNESWKIAKAILPGSPGLANFSSTFLLLSKHLLGHVSPSLSKLIRGRS